MAEPRISRVTRSREEARASYDRLSRWYDLLAGRSERRCIERGLQALRVREGETVLEIGPGTGHALVALAKAAGRSGEVWGLDLSAGMLRIAWSRVSKAGMSERVRLVCGDALTLPFPAGSFDAAFLGFTLELFDTPEIPLVLGKCRRVLRPGGRIGVVALDKEERDRPMVRLYEWAHRAFPRAADCRPILVRPVLEEAGFRIAGQAGMSMWGLPVAVVTAESGAFSLVSF